MDWSKGKFVAKTFFGLEDVLAEELKELGMQGVESLNRAVAFEGGYKDMLRANYALRTALAILKPVAEFKFREKDDFYAKIKQIDWENIFDVQKTFVIKGSIKSRVFPNTQFPILVCKDAIVDRFKEKTGERPNIETRRAAVVIDIVVSENNARVSLNTSGNPLFMRGYRQSTGDAPLNEVLAAGLIKLSGWDMKTPLWDPFCGSGTICLEAGLMVHGLPPQLERRHFAFMHMKGFRAKEWDKVKAEFPSLPKRDTVSIIGSDIDDQMIRSARTNQRGTRLAKSLVFEAKDFRDVNDRTEGTFIITNPPYGERIGDDVLKLYEDFGAYLKHRMNGTNAFILSSNKEAFNQVGLRPSKKYRVYNGKLECSYRKYELFSGSMKDKKTNESKD